MNPIALYGLTAVPASAETLLNATPIYPRINATPDAILVADTPIPTSKLAQRIDKYALHHLPEPVYNHSRRVYHYGLAIKQHRFPFPDWAFSDETYFLACMLHDIGTIAEHQDTQLSFEFVGGFLALELLQDQKEAGGSAPRAQAESVAEAIIRHQDLTSVGSITAVGQLLQLATIFGRLWTDPLPFFLFPFLFRFRFNPSFLSLGVDTPSPASAITHSPCPEKIMSNTAPRRMTMCTNGNPHVVNHTSTIDRHSPASSKF